MLSDARIRENIATMFDGVVPPAVPMASILRAIDRPPIPALSPRSSWPLAVTAAATIACVLALPVVSRALVASYEASLHAIGFGTPPAVPRALFLAPTATSLAQAQSKVAFKIVSPSGLPSDVVSSAIYATTASTYDSRKHVWSKGATFVQFAYKRAEGRSFFVMGERYDPKHMDLSLYSFDPIVDASGIAHIAKRRSYVWRNGDQAITAIVGPDLSAAEIIAMRTAMGGTPVALTDRPFRPELHPSGYRVLRLAP